jgi:hypothetical protein
MPPRADTTTKNLGRPIGWVGLLLGAIVALFAAPFLGRADLIGPGPGGGEEAAPVPSYSAPIETALSDALKRRRLSIDWVDLPAAFTPGQTSRVRVKVSNAGDGQAPSTAVVQDRYAWIDLTLIDAAGREIHRRAAIEAGSAVAGFSFVLPADVVGPIAVRADLNDRPSPQRLLDSVFGPGRQPFEVTHLASVAERVPLSKVQPTATEAMQRLLLLVALGRSSR